jgi:hypothetical protein
MNTTRTPEPGTDLEAAAEARWWCAVDDPASPEAERLEAAELLDQALHAEAAAEA